MHAKVFAVGLLVLSGCGGPPPATPDPNLAAEAAAVAADAESSARGESRGTLEPPRNVDPNATAFPPGYVGEDFAALKRQFDAKVKAAQKTKYETTAQYEKRIADLGTVLAPIDVSREYAFKLTVLDYDADKGAFTNQFGPDCRTKFGYEGEKDWLTCTMDKPLLSEEADYVGSNAFGTTRMVHKVRGEFVSAAFAKDAKASKKIFGGVIDSGLKWQCKADPAKAKSLDGQTVSFLVVGKIAGAYHVHGEGELTEAKITDDSPRDAFLEEWAIPITLTQAICYVEQTGEILLRERLN